MTFLSDIAITVLNSSGMEHGLESSYYCMRKIYENSVQLVTRQCADK